MPHSKTQTKIPWQLQVFQHSIKKQLKVKTLLELLGDVTNQQCLLITCGDNNGAINWHFRERTGRWTWGEVSEENIEQIADLLDEPVLLLPADHLPFEGNSFDCVVLIDVLEHLEEDQPILNEIRRILLPEGRLIVTVPNGDPKLLANRIKQRLEMTPEVYGHTRAGYTLAELGEAVVRAGLQPVKEAGYSRFFTEMIELAINYGFVFILSKKRGEVKKGQISPTAAGELKNHGAAYRIYGLAFPVIRMISRLDGLLPARINNAVIVEGIKPGPNE